MEGNYTRFSVEGIIELALTSSFAVKKGGNHARMEIFSTDFDNRNNDFGT